MAEPRRRRPTPMPATARRPRAAAAAGAATGDAATAGQSGEDRVAEDAAVLAGVTADATRTPTPSRTWSRTWRSCTARPMLTAEPVEEVVSPVLPVDSPVAVTVERMPEPVRAASSSPSAPGDGQAPAESARAPRRRC